VRTSDICCALNYYRLSRTVRRAAAVAEFCSADVVNCNVAVVNFVGPKCYANPYSQINFVRPSERRFFCRIFRISTARLFLASYNHCCAINTTHDISYDVFRTHISITIVQFIRTMSRVRDILC